MTDEQRIYVAIAAQSAMFAVNTLAVIWAGRRIRARLEHRVFAKFDGIISQLGPIEKPAFDYCRLELLVARLRKLEDRDREKRREGPEAG